MSSKEISRKVTDTFKKFTIVLIRKRNMQSSCGGGVPVTECIRAVGSNGSRHLSES